MLCQPTVCADRVVVHDLLEEWRKETEGLKSTRDMAKHWAYWEIIDMGVPVRRILLVELRDGGSPFIAMFLLHFAGRVPFFPVADARKNADLCLEWGKKHRFID